MAAPIFSLDPGSGTTGKPAWPHVPVVVVPVVVGVVGAAERRSCDGARGSNSCAGETRSGADRPGVLVNLGTVVTIMDALGHGGCGNHGRENGSCGKQFELGHYVCSLKVDASQRRAGKVVPHYGSNRREQA